MEDAERTFAEWLDRTGFYYIYIEQSPDSFSNRFRREQIKRPDFLVGIEDLAIVAVDIKDKSNIFLSKYDKIALDKNDVLCAYGFERIFHIPFWYAVTSKLKLDYNLWYFISVRKAMEFDTFVNTKNNYEYYAIPIKEFVSINTHRERFDKIFIER